MMPQLIVRNKDSPKGVVNLQIDANSIYAPKFRRFDERSCRERANKQLQKSRVSILSQMLNQNLVEMTPSTSIIVFQAPLLPLAEQLTILPTEKSVKSCGGHETATNRIPFYDKIN